MSTGSFRETRVPLEGLQTVAIRGDRLYFGLQGGIMLSVDRTSGREVLRVAVGRATDVSMVSTPSLSGALLAVYSWGPDGKGSWPGRATIFDVTGNLPHRTASEDLVLSGAVSELQLREEEGDALLAAKRDGLLVWRYR